MKKKEKKQSDWTEFVLGRSFAWGIIFDELDKLVHDFHNGENTENLLDQLRKDIREIQQSTDQFINEFLIGPFKKIFSRDRRNITEREYLLAQAAGLQLPTAQSIGITPVSDYEVYLNCVYEDDKVILLMNPNETPQIVTVDEQTDNIRIRIRLASSPEETNLAYYTPEQREFFAKYRPDVLKRAQQDKSSLSERECPPTKKRKSKCVKTS